MQQLITLWQHLCNCKRRIKALPLNRKPRWYLILVTLGAGIVQWGTWHIIDPCWSMFVDIWQTHNWDASATRCALLLGAVTAVWGSYFIVCHVHAAALVDRLKHDWR